MIKAGNRELVNENAHPKGRVLNLERLLSCLGNQYKSPDIHKGISY